MLPSKLVWSLLLIYCVQCLGPSLVAAQEEEEEEDLDVEDEDELEVK